jgi:hypothetical protein
VPKRDAQKPVFSAILAQKQFTSPLQVKVGPPQEVNAQWHFPFSSGVSRACGICAVLCA